MGQVSTCISQQHQRDARRELKKQSGSSTQLQADPPHPHPTPPTPPPPQAGSSRRNELEVLYRWHHI